MRILYHHRTRSTDAQRIHILEIVRAFRALGHEVELVSLVDTQTGLAQAERDAGNPLWQRLCRRIPLGYEVVQFCYNLVGIPLLVWRLLSSRFDLIYERYSLFNFTAVVTGRLFSKMVVLEVNSPFALEQQRDGDIRSFSLARWAERTICNMATNVVVVSSPLRRILIEAGVDATKIVVMPNGVRVEHFSSPATAAAERRKALRLENRVVIGFVGWFRKWHGLELLVEAFYSSGLGGEGVSLLLVGDGPAMADLKKAVAQYNLQDAVIFTGPLAHEEVASYVSLIDIAVQPAANEYCCPMKILEYMAAGKPIVAPKQENIEELLRADTEALFFTPNNAGALSECLCRLAREPETRKRLGRSAFEAIAERRFLWTYNAQRVADLCFERSK